MKLPSGREFRPYANVIGIDESGGVFGGYDQHFEGAAATLPDWLERQDWESWALEDKIALADLMIERWQIYKRRAAEEKAE